MLVIFSEFRLVVVADVIVALVANILEALRSNDPERVPVMVAEVRVALLTTKFVKIAVKLDNRLVSRLVIVADVKVALPV